jgi:hypothetical protein
MNEFTLELAFDTDDPEFCRGFEAADVFQAVRRFSAGEMIYEDDVPGALTETVHASNAEMMLRIAERFSLVVCSEEIGGGWLRVSFSEDA